MYYNKVSECSFYVNIHSLIEYIHYEYTIFIYEQYNNNHEIIIQHYTYIEIILFYILF